ncbi:MAG: hypothetical protein JW741_16650 [Sedimentisphaerales bacterium]|nr:hypothetical protein [Sedimentisphaerales bacterium]
MGVFTRRQLQERLNSFGTIVSKKKLARMIRDLNIEGSSLNSKRYLESVGLAWEIAILSSFIRLGNTQYERKISNGRRPDIFFADTKAPLLADIVTVSDDQQHKKNPAKPFADIIIKLWNDSGLQRGSLSWRIEGVDLEQQPNTPNTCGAGEPFYLTSGLRPIRRRPVKRLALPPADQLNDYVRKKTRPLFAAIHARPEEPARLVVDEQFSETIAVRFSLSYNPNGKYFTGNYPSYTQITDIESHVLWRRLTEKSEQFSSATEDVPRVVFVCDGGCSGLRDSSVGSPHAYSCGKLLDHFWRRPIFSEEQGQSWIVERGISAVAVLSIEPVNAPLPGPNRRDFLLKATLYPNPHGSHPLCQSTEELLSQVIALLPTPVESPQNTLRSMRAMRIPSRRLGFFSMAHNRVEISGIELLRILAGELTMEEFCAKYRLSLNPFKRALTECKPITSVAVEPVPDRDDDRIIIEFGVHDAALGPFVVPENAE